MLYYFIVNNNVPEINKNIIISLGFLIAAGNYYWFVNNKRYLKIYNQYRMSNKNNKLTAVFSWLYLLLAFALIPIIAVINKG